MRSMQAAHVCAAIRKECLAQNCLLHGLPEAGLCVGRQTTDSQQQDKIWPYCCMHMQLARVQLKSDSKNRLYLIEHILPQKPVIIVQRCICSKILIQGLQHTDMSMQILMPFVGCQPHSESGNPRP